MYKKIANIEEQVPDLMIGLQSQHDYRTVIEPHRHQRAQLLYPAEGSIRVHTAKHVWIVSANSALWIPSGVEHSVVVLSTVKLRTVLVEVESAKALGDECLFIQMTDLLKALILRINLMQVEPAQFKVLGDAEYSAALVHSIHVLILDEIHQCLSLKVELPWPTDSRLVIICQSLLNQPDHRQNLLLWADQIGTSPRTLMRMFLKQTGLTYRAWIQHMHIALALAKLARGESVAQIANSLGYSNSTAFSAMFKRHIGQSPQGFRG